MMKFNKRKLPCFGKVVFYHEFQNFRSSERYCTASVTCSSKISSLPSRSAIVLAILRILSYALADKPRVSKHLSSIFLLCSSSLQNDLVIEGVIFALQVISLPSNRFICIARALFTRFLISAELSPTSSSESFLKST